MDRLRNFGFQLKQISHLSAKNFERHADEAELGLTLEQCRVLIKLQSNEGITQAQLASLTEIDPMAVGRILDRIEREGWLERRPDPIDRRVWRLYLEPTASSIMKKIWTIADRARKESLAGLDTTDVDLLIGLLQKIHCNLAALVPGAVDPELVNSDNDSSPKNSKIISRTNKVRANSRPRGKSSKAAS